MGSGKRFNSSPIIFAMGSVFLILGFILLYFADQRAQNIFGFLGPLFTVGGLIAIAMSFLF